MKIPAFETKIVTTPCHGVGLPLFPFGITWDQINSMLIANAPNTQILNENHQAIPVAGFMDANQMFNELRQAIQKGLTVKSDRVELLNKDIALRAIELHPRYRAHLSLYVGQENNTSFRSESNPLVVLCVQEPKTFWIEGYDPISLAPQDWLYIPPNTPHRFTSQTVSATFFISFHRWNDNFSI